MGDTVNVAARLEGINKYTGTSILLSEIVAKACEKYVACRRIDLVRVAGRNAPIWIYEPVCLMQDRDSQVEDNIERFTEGLNLYYSKKFESAKYIFESLSTIDPVAQNLVVRAAEMIKTPPAEDWTGVRQFTEK
jgi:adenylate cyclase